MIHQNIRENTSNSEEQFTKRKRRKQGDRKRGVEDEFSQTKHGGSSPLAWCSPVTIGSCYSQDQHPILPLAIPPGPSQLQPVLFTDGELCIPTSRVRLYLLNARCAWAKNKTKGLSRTLSKFLKHTGWKMEPRFLLFLNLTLAMFIIK